LKGADDRDPSKLQPFSRVTGSSNPAASRTNFPHPPAAPAIEIEFAGKAWPWLGALLLAYYDPDGRLIYAGRAGTGIDHAEPERLWRRLQPLATSEMPLDAPPPRANPFGSPLVLSRVHWVRPELVAEVKYLAWTEDHLLRQVVYEGLREDKPAAEVRRQAPHPKPAEPMRPVARSKQPRSG
jgi:ATP-dependent DNA ligase